MADDERIFAECLVCFETFNEEENRPMVGACGHSLCQDCSGRLPRCPICLLLGAFQHSAVNFQLLEQLAMTKTLQLDKEAAIEKYRSLKLKYADKKRRVKEMKEEYQQLDRKRLEKKTQLKAAKMEIKQLRAENMVAKKTKEQCSDCGYRVLKIQSRLCTTCSKTLGVTDRLRSKVLAHSKTAAEPPMAKPQNPTQNAPPPRKIVSVPRTAYDVYRELKTSDYLDLPVEEREKRILNSYIEQPEKVKELLVAIARVY